MPLLQIIWGLRFERSFPSSLKLPEVGLNAPLIKLNSVVFPAPFGPMIPTICFLETSKLTSHKACRPPNLSARSEKPFPCPRLVRGFPRLQPGAERQPAARGDPADRPARRVARHRRRLQGGTDPAARQDRSPQGRRHQERYPGLDDREAGGERGSRPGRAARVAR